VGNQLSKTKAGSSPGDLQPSGFLNLTLIRRKPFLQTKVSVDTRDFRLFQHVVITQLETLLPEVKFFGRGPQWPTKRGTVKHVNTRTRYWIWIS